MTEEQLQAIKEMAEAATPGTWSVNTENLWDKGNPVGSFYAGKDAKSNCHQWVYIITDASVWDMSIASVDAAFIAAARTAVPELLAEVERLKAEVVEKKDTIQQLSRQLTEIRRLVYAQATPTVFAVERRITELESEIARLKDGAA